MLEIKSDKSREKDTKAIVAKHDSLFSLSVSVGECVKCPLKDTCSFANDIDKVCRATAVAIRQFEGLAYRSPWIKEEDALTIRNLGAIWGSIVVAEMYMQKYGSVTLKTIGGNRQMVFTELHKDYMRLINMFQDRLGDLGLSPMGRKLLRSGNAPPGGTGGLLEAYVKSHGTAENTPAKVSTEYRPSYKPKKKTDEIKQSENGEDVTEGSDQSSDESL